MQERQEAPDPAERPDHLLMKRRLVAALSDPEIRMLAAQDFKQTFDQLGLDDERSNALVSFVIDLLRSGDALASVEAKILQILRTTLVDGQPITALLKEKLAGRAQIIFGQVQEYFRAMAAEGIRTVVDYGCGDAQVSLLLQQEFPSLAVHGCDPKDYRSSAAKEAGLPFTKIVQNRVPGVEDGAYEAALMTNAAHHEAQNEALLAELSRITVKRLVVIETVPMHSEDGRHAAMERERTFLNDYLFNRCFHDADIPVPGTYETYEEWPKRFEKYGWRLAEKKDLGVDQPTIADRHVLYVFERIPGFIQRVAEDVRAQAGDIVPPEVLRKPDPRVEELLRERGSKPVPAAIMSKQARPSHATHIRGA